MSIIIREVVKHSRKDSVETIGLGKKKSFNPKGRKTSMKNFKEILLAGGDDELDLVERPKLRPTTKYMNIFVRCSHLVNLDTFSYSDPMVSLFIKDENKFQYVELDRTETCKDSLNPEFNMSLFVNSKLDICITSSSKSGACW
jgi:hypothetical protein